MVHGDSFGEIGILFNCNRTCTVQSIDYNILARVSRPKLRQFYSDYPSFLTQLQKQVFGYSDRYKREMKNVFEKVEYLMDLQPHLFHQLIYAF